jgi:hypothetical protein
MEEKETVDTELDADEAIDEAFEDAESEVEDEELDYPVEDEGEDDDSGEDDESDTDDAAEDEEDPFDGLFDDDEESEEGEEDTEGGSSDEEDPQDERDVGAPSPTEAGGAAKDALAKYDALSNEVKETLKKLGYKGEGDPMEALKRAQAEASGMSSADYDRKQAFEKQAALDIEAIHKAFPETAKFKHLRELPHVGKFARLMDNKEMKLSVVEAFAASHPEIVSAHVAGANRAKNLAGTKSHLSSSVPKGAKDVSVNMTRRELNDYREMFPELSDKQIKELYKSANK